MLRFSISILFLSFVGMSTLAKGAEIRDPGPFYGFWEMQEPAGDTCVVNIKRGNRVSCFFTGTSSSDIMKGTWVREEGKLIATWESGHRDVFTPIGNDALLRGAYSPSSALKGDPDYETRAIKIDSRIPGSLGVDRSATNTSETEAASAPVRQTASPRETAPAQGIPMRNDFNGFWKVHQGSGGFLGIGASGAEDFYLRLQRNGTAKVSLRRWDPGNEVTGKWQLEGDAAVIEWPTGQREILHSQNGSYSLHFYGARTDLSDSPDRILEVQRSTPGEASRFFTDANVSLFTMSDVRGIWIPANTREPLANYLFIEGWGHASRPANASGEIEQGEWKMFTDRVVVTWPDGSKSVLRMDVRGWKLESFPPGVPATGAPASSAFVRRVAESPDALQELIKRQEG
jgi:hypothetical protein